MENKETIIDRDVKLEQFVVERIETLCKVNNISKYKLGQLTGIAQSSLSTMKRGKTLPSLGTLDKLCDGLGITIFDFFDVDTEKVAFTSQEMVMLRYWNQMTPEQKKITLAFAKGVLSATELEEEAEEEKE